MHRGFHRMSPLIHNQNPVFKHNPFKNWTPLHQFYYIHDLHIVLYLKLVMMSNRPLRKYDIINIFLPNRLHFCSRKTRDECSDCEVVVKLILLFQEKLCCVICQDICSVWQWALWSCQMKRSSLMLSSSQHNTLTEHCHIRLSCAVSKITQTQSTF